MAMMHSTRGDSLADVVERIIDKGLIINADIAISIVGTELLSLKLRAAVASFETAAKWGLAFPSDTRLCPPEPNVGLTGSSTKPAVNSTRVRPR